MVSKRARPFVAAKSNDTDDFTQIKGIGPAFNNHLHKAGILTFAQLGALSPDDILKRLSPAHGITAKQIDRQRWVRQALDLASGNVVSNPSTRKLPQDHQRTAMFTIELLIDETNCLRRTKVVDVESLQERRWSGWDETKLLDFMITVAGFSMPSKEPVPLESSTSPALESLDETVPALTETIPEPDRFNDMISLKEFVTVLKGSTTPRMIIANAQPYFVRFVLELSKMTLAADLLNYELMVNAKNMFGGSQHKVRQVNGTISPNNPIVLEIDGTPLPPGTYRLGALVSLMYPSDESILQPMMAAFEGPLLQVY